MEKAKDRALRGIMQLYSERLCWPATARDDIFRRRVAEVLDDTMQIANENKYQIEGRNERSGV